MASILLPFAWDTASDSDGIEGKTWEPLSQMVVTVAGTLGSVE